MTPASILALLLISSPPPPLPPADSPWEFDCCWAELNMEIATRRWREPLHLDFRLMDVAFTRGAGRYVLQMPVLGFGLDLRRPSGAKGGVTMSFLQAPLLMVLALPAFEHKEPTLLQPVLGALLWLAGGTFRWTPGGIGNLARSAKKATSWSLLLKSRFDVVLFGGPDYVRETLALGLGLRRDEVPSWTSRFTPDWGCSVGVLVSAARESGGSRSFDPGVWAACNIWFLPVD
jgi:hypothetical protein